MAGDWRDWLVGKWKSDRSESPIEALFYAVYTLLRDPLFLPGQERLRVKQQAVIGAYRADFLFECIGPDKSVAWIVVELDGHNFHERTKEQAAHDRQRDRWMQANGYKVIRFTGSEVWANPFDCVEQLADEIHVAIYGMTKQQSKAAAGMAAINRLFEE